MVAAYVDAMFIFLCGAKSSNIRLESNFNANYHGICTGIGSSCFL